MSFLELQWILKATRVDIPLTVIVPPHLCACTKSGIGFPTSYVMGFLCSVSSVKIRDDCSFC